MQRGIPSSRGGRVRPALTCVGLLVCLATAPATQKSTSSKPSSNEKAVFEKAITELKREYTAHTKSAQSNPLRAECDYFAKSKPDVSVESVLSALDKSVGSDPRLTAYVKWQLLSALPDNIDDKYAARLATIYERAPAPAMRYGATPQEQKQLDTALVGAQKPDDVALTEKLDEAVNRGVEADKPVLAYRDELYKRLPPSREKFLAALRDANVRLSMAAPKDKLAEKLGPDLQAWAVSGQAKAGQVKEIADVLGKLRFVESPTYYASAGVRRGKLTWVEKNDSLMTPKKFSDLHKALLEAAGVASSSSDADPAGKASKKSSDGKKETKKAGNSS